MFLLILAAYDKFNIKLLLWHWPQNIFTDSHIELNDLLQFIWFWSKLALNNNNPSLKANPDYIYIKNNVKR